MDDYREAYRWLREHTPQDARVMAWWDYGYQIAGIANRTTIADGNTWNHEHIALLGLALTSPLEESHAIARHLADYVLVWKVLARPRVSTHCTHTVLCLSSSSGRPHFA